MRNYARFQDNIHVSGAISVIKDLRSCYLWRYFLWGEFIGGLSAFIDVKFALVADFYGVIYAIELERRVLLMYDLNVILSWLVVHLLLGLRFCGCFVIGGTLVLNIMGK